MAELEKRIIKRIVVIEKEEEGVFYAGMRVIVDNTTGCWNCIERPPTGHGYVTLSRDGERGAHRIAYKHAHGSIPKGKYVLHKCDNRICVNPDHLFLGTIRDNNKDMVNKGRQAKGEQINTNILTEEQVVEILKDYTSLHTELAKKYGVTKGAIYRIRKRLNWKHVVLPEGYIPYVTPARAKSRKGEKHGGCKLTNNQILEIRENIIDDQYELARKYNVSQTHIWRIKHNHTRKIGEIK